MTEHTGQGLLAETERAWFSWRRAIALVQVYLRPDVEWDVGRYGNNAVSHPEGMQFRMFRSTPADGERMEGSTLDAARDFAAWLSEHGWRVTGPREYSPDLGRIAVMAERAEDYVAEILVQFVRTEQMDGITLSATSTALPGDPGDLFTAKYRGATREEYEREFEPLPQREAPQSRPVFIEQLRTVTPA